jgi:hypothetical protein
MSDRLKYLFKKRSKTSLHIHMFTFTDKCQSLYTTIQSSKSIIAGVIRLISRLIQFRRPIRRNILRLFGCPNYVMVRVP